MRILIVLLLAATSAHAQNFLPDSVREQFSALPRDSSYVDKLNALATTYLRTNPGTARVIAEHTIPVAQQVRHTRGYARALVVVGNSYWTEGVFEYAQNYYLLAARQYQLVNDSTGLGQTYNNIGEVYKRLNNSQKAMQYLLQAIDLQKGDEASQAVILYNIGELYVKLKQPEKAMEYIDKSVSIARKSDNKRVLAYNLWTLGAIELLKKNYDEGLNYYVEAGKIWTDLGDLRALTQTYQEIAELYRLKHQYDAAEKFIRKAINVAGTINVADLQVNNYERMARIDSARGNYERAFYYLSRHNSLKDSVYNLLKVEQIMRVQAIYETETRDRENKQLRADREIQDTKLSQQRFILMAISISLVIAGISAWMLNRQRKKIQEQKEAIEVQAAALIKLNDELVELNKTLELRITERTNQLTIQNQRLTDYTFVNAHKLRAPVASILGLVNLIPQVDDNERAVLLTHLKTCGEQLDMVIHDLSRSLESAIVPSGVQDRDK